MPAPTQQQNCVQAVVCAVRVAAAACKAKQNGDQAEMAAPYVLLANTGENKWNSCGIIFTELILSYSTCLILNSSVLNVTGYFFILDFSFVALYLLSFFICNLRTKENSSILYGCKKMYNSCTSVVGNTCIDK